MDKQKIHDLKTWPVVFDAVRHGGKTAEFRKNDRDFKVGQFLNLREWSPDTKEYTGSTLLARINHIVEGEQFGIPPGYCVMSITIDKVQLFTPPTDGCEHCDEPIPCYKTDCTYFATDEGLRDLREQIMTLLIESDPRTRTKVYTRVLSQKEMNTAYEATRGVIPALSKVADSIISLLSTHIDQIARENGYVKREKPQRVISIPELRKPIEVTRKRDMGRLPPDASQRRM